METGYKSPFTTFQTNNCGFRQYVFQKKRRSSKVRECDGVFFQLDPSACSQQRQEQCQASIFGYPANENFYHPDQFSISYFLFRMLDIVAPKFCRYSPKMSFKLAIASLAAAVSSCVFYGDSLSVGIYYESVSLTLVRKNREYAGFTFRMG